MNPKYHEDLLNKVDIAIAEHKMIYDDFGNPIDYKYLYVNQAFCNSVSMMREDIIGKTVLELFPSVESFWIERYNKVVTSGESKTFINYTKAFKQYFRVHAFKSKERCFVANFKDITGIINMGTSSDKENIVSGLFSEGKVAYFEFDLKNRSLNHSDNLIDILGINIDSYEVFLEEFYKHTHRADLSDIKKGIADLIRNRSNELTLQMRFFDEKRKDYVWISFFAYVEAKERNHATMIKGIIKDINIEKSQSLELERMNKMFKETRKVANIVTFYYDFEKEQFNHSIELDEFVGIPNMIYLDQIKSVVHHEDIEKYNYSTQEIQKNREGVVSNYRIIKEDSIRHIQSSVFGEFDEFGKIHGVFGILKDITELEEQKEEIAYFANHDILTGLFNRNNFEEYSKTLDYEANVCVLICDVDGLKLINDAFGHLEGDRLLVKLANILTFVGGSENAYRIGGDEFVILIHNANEDSPLKIETEIKKEIHKMKVYGVGFGASLGYSFIEKAKTFEEAFRQAENLMYRRKLTERKSRKSTALETIMQTMHEKTEETEEHCSRVGYLAAELLKSTGKKRDYEIEEIKLVADVHDIGKISISDKILNKPGPLDEKEFKEIQYHSESGYKIISNIIENEDIAVAVLYHHEKYDGTGYPHNLKGEKIPLYSRIISICDAYDAMTNDRIYRKALSKKQAIKELKLCSGTQFDPNLIERFLKIIKK
jgi:diguanylate cyclase (GGDEF)-like protein